MRFFTLLTILVILSGCSTHSSNLQVGNNQSYLSLTDQRQALRTVQEYDSLPEGGKILGIVGASRCHRNFTETEPSNDMVTVDLKVAAYAKGADGITDIKIKKESGLSSNCWYILDGSATMFILPE